MNIGDVPLTMEVDTGASFSVVSKSTFDQMLLSLELKPTSVCLKTFTGENLPVLDNLLPMYVTIHKNSLLTIVAGHDGPSLLYVILSMPKSKLSQVFDQYSQVFCKGFKAKLFVVDKVQPIFCKARPVPYQIRPLVKKLKKKLIGQHIIEPVVFSEWAAPIVTVMKSDKTIRICGDFKLTVNKVPALDRYPIPKVEDLFSTLSGGTAFTKLDLSQAYQ